MTETKYQIFNNNVQFSEDEIEAEEKKQNDGFGEKTIGFWGGVALLVNNITGSAMVTIPVLFNQAGWFIPTLAFLITAVLAGFSCLVLAKTIQTVPGNKDFEARVEFINLSRMLLPRWAYICSTFLFLFFFMAQILGNIVVSAQTMDNTLLKVFNVTCALAASSEPFQCIHVAAGKDSPFGSLYVISLGFVVVMLVTIPMGLFNLDDNIWVQKTGMILLIFALVTWQVQFEVSGLEAYNMPFSAPDLSQVISNIVFNYGFVVTVPSWLNEKRPEVSVPKTVVTTLAITSIMFLTLGLFGALAFTYPEGADLLSILTKPAYALHYRIFLTSQIAAYIFPFATLITSIPVFSIIIRYNLLEEKLCGKWAANIFAVILPWLVALIFYPGNALNTLINWASVLLVVMLNFVLPNILYCVAYRMRHQKNPFESFEDAPVTPKPEGLPADQAAALLRRPPLSPPGTLPVSSPTQTVSSSGNTTPTEASAAKSGRALPSQGSFKMPPRHDGPSQGPQPSAKAMDSEEAAMLYRRGRRSSSLSGLVMATRRAEVVTELNELPTGREVSQSCVLHNAGMVLKSKHGFHSVHDYVDVDADFSFAPREAKEALTDFRVLPRWLPFSGVHVAIAFGGIMVVLNVIAFVLLVEQAVSKGHTHANTTHLNGTDF